MSKASGSKAPPREEGQPEEEQDLDAYGRKIWDKDQYIEKAKTNIMFGPERIGRRKDPVIPLPSSQRTYLKQRSLDLELEKDLGKSRSVTMHTIKPLQGGYWCSVCECLLKDSSTYLEHVNGRRHNRNLGMNMKVEKIGIDRVKEKLRSMRKQPEEVESVDIAARIEALEEEDDEKKRRKKEKKKNKKRKAGGGDVVEEDDDDEGGAGDGGPAQKLPRKGVEDEDDGEEQEETEEMKMLRAMGLPTGFG